MDTSQDLLKYLNDQKTFIPKKTDVQKKKWISPKYCFIASKKYEQKFPSGKWLVLTDAVKEDNNQLTQHDRFYLCLSKHFEDIFVCTSDDNQKYFYTVKASSSLNSSKKTGLIQIYTGDDDKNQIINNFRKYINYEADIKWQPNQNNKQAQRDQNGNIIYTDVSRFIKS